MADAPISEELTVLRKRARRRLVGAVALVFMALIALWTVMDDRPPQSLVNQSVDIVSSSPGLSSTVPAATKPQTQPLPAMTVPEASSVVPVDPAPAVPAPQPEPASAQPLNPPPVQPAPIADKPATAKPDAAKPVSKPKPIVDPARILDGMDEEPAKPAAKPAVKAADTGGERYFVQLGAFADKDKAMGLVSKARQAGVSIQTETVNTDKGALTRLRAGPFAQREAAEKVRGKLAAAGVTSTVVGK
ncbi:SPOR domain-containing protein [Chitinimonas sp. BJYL2]|uniref:SPOR domain-containing protein n=1 Tax=Chitinimonas sp. BJYL2 TaxID=2976696 RepID=UPI0022B4F4F7|nr:SPOR domain-containing protein [Chitinimonas sp. BJYL2]